MFCNDLRPSLAVGQDGTVVVIAEEVVSRTLTCYVGKINNAVSEINFTKTLDVFSGITASVAINDQHIIMLYRIAIWNQQPKVCKWQPQG